ncbi:MAG: HEPN domain-containing protein, partial [Anaerolineales bacterium]
KEEAKRWLDQAENDLAMAALLLDRDHFGGASFHAQQAAEKGLKAVLLETQGRFPRIHDLKALGAEGKAPPELLGRLRALSAAYVAYRYPDVEQPVTGTEARGLVGLAEEVVAWARRRLS